MRLSTAVWVLFAVEALLALGWVFGAVRNWDEIASRPVRLAYLICDFLLVIPVGLVAGLGVLTGKRWASPLFGFALGALLFDTAHGVFYLLWDNYFGVPWIGAFGLLVLLTVYAVLAMRALSAERDRAALEDAR